MIFSFIYLGLRRGLELILWLRRSDADEELEILVLRHQVRSTKELMARMGHASPRAALRYQHATPERDQKIADAVSEAVEGRTGGAARVTQLRG